MSAPQIPNLLSLRGRGGARRGRARGGFASPAAPGAAAGHDATIQRTDTDASVSRLSAVDLGYLEDPFAQYFVQSAGPPTRRLPIINRGTYTRTTALDRLVSAFLSSQDGAAGGRKQIISLGAGTDTRPFRLFSQPGTRRLVYHEVDFPATATRKRRVVQSVPALRSIIPLTDNPQPGSTSEGVTNSDNWVRADLPNDCSYYCHGLDLRDLVDGGPPPPPAPGFPTPTAEAGSATTTTTTTAAAVAAAPQPQAPTPALLHGIEPDLPTLLISECCLCYLEPSQARSVVRHFASRLSSLSLVLYEPIRPADPFGRQMVANLAARRIRMPTLAAYPDVAGQRARLAEAGLADGVRAMTVGDIWALWVAADEKERVDQLEGLDEVEEWELLAGHYVVAWAWRGQGFEGWKDI